MPGIHCTLSHCTAKHPILMLISCLENKVKESLCTLLSAFFSPKLFKNDGEADLSSMDRHCFQQKKKKKKKGKQRMGFLQHRLRTKKTLGCLVCVLFSQSCLTLYDPMDCSPTRLLYPWNSPGNNTGVGCTPFSRVRSP